MIDNGPGSVEDDDGDDKDDKDATSIDSGNHLGLAAAMDEEATWVGYTTCPCHSIPPLPLCRKVLTAIHAAGLRKEGGPLAMAQTLGQ
jgi:hypothetical protein